MQITRWQRAAVLVGIALALLSLMYPPQRVERRTFHTLTLEDSGVKYYTYEWHWLWWKGGTIDFGRLFLEWALIVLVIGGVAFALAVPAKRAKREWTRAELDEAEARLLGERSDSDEHAA